MPLVAVSLTGVQQAFAFCLWSLTPTLHGWKLRYNAAFQLWKCNEHFSSAHNSTGKIVCKDIKYLPSQSLFIWMTLWKYFWLRFGERKKKFCKYTMAKYGPSPLLEQTVISLLRLCLNTQENLLSGFIVSHNRPHFSFWNTYRNSEENSLYLPGLSLFLLVFSPSLQLLMHKATFPIFPIPISHAVEKVTFIHIISWRI